ncbi:hypothetical protein Pcinc_039494 [Petrolisthes cinctipes]|uniref:Uncharacterized protein n=1 Tax=Petrolisthes cinctipes TaxID=88211 RepID=A0AAE1EKI9_PETCI|nr:hypothetical protein Pcinc_039494 [Petrolisthes cinctipes]
MVVEGLAQSVVTLMVVMVMAGEVTVSAHRDLSYIVSVKLKAETVAGSSVGEKLWNHECNNVSRRRNSRKVVESDTAETAVIQQAQQHSITHPLTSTSPQQKEKQGQQELELTVEDHEQQQQKKVMTTVRVAAEEWVPHIGVSQDIHGNITIRGPMANLLTLLAKAINFRYTLVRPPDGAWGIPTEGGDWNGMIGMVKRNEADLALGPFGLTYSRSRVVDFSSPILIDYYRILVRRPRPETDPIGFLRPFTWEVWVGLVMCVWVVGGVLFLAASLHSPQSKKEKEEEWGRRKKTSTDNKDDVEEGPISQLLTQLWLVYGSLLSQPEVSYADERWRLGQGWRVAAAGWCVAALVVARSYSSTLTSLLAVRNVPVRYNYLSEVIADAKLNLVFEKATALVEHMSTVQRGVYRDLANTRGQDRAHFLASSALYDAAYTTVRSGTHALLVEDTTCRKVYSDDFTKHGTVG